MTYGDVEQEVREDIEALGELTGMEPSLAATAYALAARIDDQDTEDKSIPALTRELRATLTQLFENHSVEDDDDEDLGPT
jgi:hypothetical protein